MKPQKTIIITSSHHTPAIELIHQLQSDPLINWQIHYLAHAFPSETHLTHTIIPQLKVNFHPIESGKFDRRFVSKTIAGVPKTTTAIFQSFQLLHQIKPDVVISFGGYVSVPVIFSAKILGIKSIIHEQTLTNSLTTKICARLVNKIALSFDNKNQISQLPQDKIVITGNLIRQEIFQNTSKTFGHLKSPLIYITGGSQGSSTINQNIKKILPKLIKYNIIHQTGLQDFSEFNKLKKANYYPVEYVNSADIGWIYHHAQLTISRSGANTCQELDILHQQSILIPFPYAQQNEQLLNAQWLHRQLPESTIILDQFELTPKKLLDTIQQLSKQSNKISDLKKFQNPQLLKLIHELV